MAYRDSMVRLAWPVPESPPVAHDLWLGIMGSIYGKVVLVEEKLIFHRLHKNNYSWGSKMNLFCILKNRIYFAHSLVKRIIQNKINVKNISILEPPR